MLASKGESQFEHLRQLHSPSERTKDSRAVVPHVINKTKIYIYIYVCVCVCVCVYFFMKNIKKLYMLLNVAQ